MTKVKIYSTPTCPYCNMAEDFLKEQKVAFEKIDVSEDRKAAEYMVKISGQMGVPVLEIGKDVIVGFNVEAIKKSLKLK